MENAKRKNLNKIGNSMNQQMDKPWRHTYANLSAVFDAKKLRAFTEFGFRIDWIQACVRMEILTG